MVLTDMNHRRDAKNTEKTLLKVKKISAKSILSIIGPMLLMVSAVKSNILSLRRLRLCGEC
jgi:hypothetical protein